MRARRRSPVAAEKMRAAGARALASARSGRGAARAGGRDETLHYKTQPEGKPKFGGGEANEAAEAGDDEVAAAAS